MNRQSSIRRREHIIVYAVSLGLVLFAVQLVRIQIFGHRFWEKEARKQELTLVKQKASRGDILDRTGRPLATSLPLTYAIGFRPYECPDKQSLRKQLAPLLDPVNKEWRERIKHDGKFTYLARRVNWKTAQKVEALHLECLELCQEPRRSYPCGSLAASIIGFSDIDEAGQEGIELAFDEVLRGNDAQELVWQDAGGRPYLALSSSDEGSLKGADVQLTIDIALQTIVEEELQKACRNQKCSRACALLTNPQTGEILALSTYPGFDANNPGLTATENRKCWPITDVMEHGSTLKLFAFAGALEDNLFRPNETIFCENGQFAIPGTIIHDATPHGVLTFTEVLQKSSNIGTVKIAERLGRNRLYETARSLGFGTLTEISFPGEQPGRLPPPHEWSKTTLANFAFGHGLSATPLQVATAYGAVANGGYLMKPMIVKRICYSSGAIKDLKPTMIRQALPTSVAQALCEMLAGVTENGTGQSAAISGWRVAGKTGTAQKIDEKTHEYCKNRFISSFVGFVPADAARYLMLVVIDDPRREYYGGQVAAPIFHNAMTRILESFPPAQTEPLLAVSNASLPKSSKNSVAFFAERNPNPQVPKMDFAVAFAEEVKSGFVRVPSVEGMSLRSAIRELTSRNLDFRVSGGTEIVCQSPPAGSSVPVGTICYILGRND
jgi:cell division protein FtsI (penicillin-binding protein 3)